jgi:hypothetical protein
VRRRSTGAPLRLRSRRGRNRRGHNLLLFLLWTAAPRMGRMPAVIRRSGTGGREPASRSGPRFARRACVQEWGHEIHQDPARGRDADRARAARGRARLLRPDLLRRGVRGPGARDGVPPDQPFAQPPRRHAARHALPEGAARGGQARAGGARRDPRRDRRPAPRQPQLRAVAGVRAHRRQRADALRAEGFRPRLPDAHGRHRRHLPGLGIPTRRAPREGCAGTIRPSPSPGRGRSPRSRRRTRPGRMWIRRRCRRIEPGERGRWGAGGRCWKRRGRRQR